MHTCGCHSVSGLFLFLRILTASVLILMTTFLGIVVVVLVVAVLVVVVCVGRGGFFIFVIGRLGFCPYLVPRTYSSHPFTCTLN